MKGPLRGLRGVELAGIGPAPFAAMVLADLGADVIRVDRTVEDATAYTVPPAFQLMNRGRRSICVDLKHDRGVDVVRRLVADADFFIEGYRPGVAERLGVGPPDLMQINQGLVYARMTGWGQHGPRAETAGHDLNYLAITGLLGALGPRGSPPLPPLNVIGDFGGGGMQLVVGILAGLLERSRSGLGQVVDASIAEGASLLATFVHGQLAAGDWVEERERNLIDGGAHVYGCYETADGRYMAVGSIEKRFYSQLLVGLGLERSEMPSPGDKERWTEGKRCLEEVFRTKTQAEWVEVFESLDACVTPVLSFAQAYEDPQLRARRAFVEVEGVMQPGPAPSFERTPGSVDRSPPRPGQHTLEVLAEADFTNADIEALKSAGAVA